MNIWKLVSRNLFRRKLRFLFTLIGITIGIATIVGLLFLTSGVEQIVTNEANALGADALVTPQNWCSYEMVSVIQGEQVGESISFSDYENISKIPNIIASPIIVKSTGIEGKPVTVMGVYPTKMETTREWEVADGRLLADNDTFSVVVGSGIAHYFDIIIGEVVKIRNTSFMVIGILKPTNTNDDNAVFIPITTAMDVYNTNAKVSFIVVKVKDVSKMDYYTLEIQNVANVNVVTDKQLIQTSIILITSVQNAAKIIGLIAVVAGFFGILNTMVTNIHERRREIGIQKALGATKQFVFLSFLLEAVVFGIIGGLIGYGVGAFAAQTALPRLFPVQSLGFLQGQRVYPQIAPLFDPSIFIFSLLFSLSISIIGALYPAWCAARVPPVEAMRRG